MRNFPMPWPRSDFHTTTDSMKHADGIEGMGVILRWPSTVGSFLLSLGDVFELVNTKHVGGESLLDSSDHIRAPMDLGHSWLINVTVSWINSGTRWIGMTLNFDGSLDIPWKEHKHSVTQGRVARVKDEQREVQILYHDRLNASASNATNKMNEFHDWTLNERPSNAGLESKFSCIEKKKFSLSWWKPNENIKSGNRSHLIRRKEEGKSRENDLGNFKTNENRRAASRLFTFCSMATNWVISRISIIKILSSA